MEPAVVGSVRDGRRANSENLKGPFQFRESFVFTTTASVSFQALWWMVEVEL